MTKTSHALDAQRRIMAPMNAMKPIMDLQVSMLRMWADSIERFAGNYEKGLDETATDIEKQSDKKSAGRTGLSPRGRPGA